MTPRLGTSALSRRALLTGTVAGAGAATTAALAGGQPRSGVAAPERGFFGAHQAGIISRVLPFVCVAGFDVVSRDRAALVRLLQTWSSLAADLTTTPEGGSGPVPTRLTLTFGFGPALFAGDRFGLGDQRPSALVPLPAFRGEALDPVAGNGDLCVQACATNPTAAHQAIRALLNIGREHVALRWRQNGFCTEDGTADPPGLFEFRDGTCNLDVQDPKETAEHLWVDDGPPWMHGGTYLVMRRIRLLLDTWDRTGLAEQEAVIGRRLAGNQRIAAGPDAHVRLAAPAANNGAKLLRRSYSYDAGVDPNGLMDAGLIFLCFQRDPGRQFVPIQRRLAASDALNAFSQHRASGLFACPPGAQPGSFIGAELLS
ncbi:MAG TPA: Dyp-type peroxidase [Pilimelia sp.]|nr:Dyp-type peroxidase [Pilimelia sp.]